MPSTTSCPPSSAASPIVSSSIGIITSSPSTEKRAAQVALEALDLRQALEQPALVVRVEGVVVAARLDHRPQPDALLVVGDVLDLVGAGAAVDLAQLRKDVGERLTRDVDSENVGRDQSL